MLRKTKENFYILLELSTTENNASRIEAALKKKQTQWSKLRNHPTKGRTAQQYLGLIPEIKKVMGDDILRKAEAQEAALLKEKADKEKYQELDEYIKILSAKGKILEQEVFNLAKEFQTIPEAKIRNRIKVAIVKDKPLKSQVQKQLDKTTAKVIYDALNIVGKSSLYDFLELSPTSSLKLLQQKTNEKDAEIKKIAHKDALITASSTLVGICQSVFKTLNMRNAYDASLAQQHLTEFDKSIDMAGSSGSIDLPTYEKLLQKAISFGLDKQIARQYILDYCQNKKWSLQIAEKFAVNDMQQCGVCGFLNIIAAKKCEKCGYALQVNCPQCQTSNPSTANNCRNCGFGIGDMPHALRLLRQGQIAFSEKNFSLANKLLQQANIYWPHHPEIKRTLQTIKSDQQTINNLIEELHSLINQASFYQARTALARLRQLDPSHPELSLANTIKSKIASAETYLYKAKLVKEENARIETYSYALAAAKDCPEALDEMAKLPPAPATQLQANSTHYSMQLNWKPSSSNGEIIYQLTRKTTSFPNHKLDGKIIGKTSQTRLEDTATSTGEEYYYAVYSVRGQIYSRQAAIIGPVLCISEIKDLVVIPGDNCIKLNWISSPKIYAIEVWRKKNGLPKKRGDGYQLPDVRVNGVTDKKLKNGTNYGYLIILIFQDKKGQNHFSQGITCLSQPVEPPPPVEDLTVLKHEDHLDIFDIKWTPPKKGSVQLFYSQQALPLALGDSLSTSQLAELGTPITLQHSDWVRWRNSSQGIIFIVPVTVEGKLAIIGSIKMLNSLNEVNNLRGIIDYNKLYLDWEWPKNTNQVIVAYRFDDYPKNPNDSLANLQTFTKQANKKTSTFIIHQPLPNDYYFTVFVVAGEADNLDNLIYSGGKRCLITHYSSRDIYYEIKTKKSLFRKKKYLQLRLSTRGASLTMPASLLLRKSDNLPLRSSDGDIISRIPANTVIGKKPLVINIPHQETQKNSYAKLFFINKEDYQKYRLVHPSKKKLCICDTF